MTIHKITTAVFCLFLCASCQKVLVTPTAENNQKAVFEQVWKVLDEKYSFFDYKHINWDSIGSVYRAKVTDNISDDSLFTVLDNMLYQLKDGHVNLSSPFNRSRSWDWFLGFPQNYDAGLVLRHYIPNFKNTGSFAHQLIRGVGYIHYPSFSIPISDYDMDYIINEYSNAKGLIIDVRDNGGGDPANIFMLLKRLTDKDVLVGKTAQKNGSAHNAFGTTSEIWVKPDTKSKKYLGKKIVVLTNRMCYSATSHFAAWIKAFPNVTLVGDQTGGGGGLPTSLQLSNGWVVRYSSTLGLDAKGFNFENGVPPDIKVDMSPADILRGVDSILEKGLAQF
jgi:hypothetical protein